MNFIKLKRELQRQDFQTCVNFILTNKLGLLFFQNFNGYRTHMLLKQ